MSLIVASRTYEDAKAGGEEQLRALEGARSALEKSTEAQEEQVAVLIEEQSTLRDLLVLTREQTDRSRRAPKIALFVGEVRETEWAKARLAVGRSERERIDIVLRNEGTAPLLSPSAHIVAEPATVVLEGSNSAVKEAPSAVQFNGRVPLPPYAEMEAVARFTVHAKIPTDLAYFDLSIRAWGENASRRPQKVRIHVAESR